MLIERLRGSRNQTVEEETPRVTARAPADRKGAESKGVLAQVASWFSDHQQHIDQLFGRDDADELGSVGLKDFQLGLSSLGVPLQHFQLLALIRLLKNSDDTVSYQNLSRRARTLSDASEVQTLMSEDDTRQDACGLEQQANTDKQRLVRLNVRLIHFDSSPVHPGNFQVFLPSSCRVFSLMETIRDRVGIQTSDLWVFRSRVPGEDALLPPTGSLEESGIRGGPEESPPEATVYYDYRPLLTDCPLLNCDHYVRSETHAVTMARRRSNHGVNHRGETAPQNIQTAPTVFM